MTETSYQLPPELNIPEELAKIVTVIEESKQNITSTQFNVMHVISSSNQSTASSQSSSQYPPKYRAQSRTS